MPRKQTIPGDFPAMFQGKTYGPGEAVVPDDFPKEEDYQAKLEAADRSQSNEPLTVSDTSAETGAALSNTAASMGKKEQDEPPKGKKEK